MTQNETQQFNGLDYTVRKDGSIKITNPDTGNTLYLAREELEHFLTGVEDFEKTDSEDEALLLDEEDKLYGYGIMNVGQNALLNLNQYGVSGSSYYENDVVTSSKEKLKDAFAEFVSDNEVAESMSDLSSFRVVQVRLDNSLDKDCVEIGERVINEEVGE